jgi:tyrosinase
LLTEAQTLALGTNFTSFRVMEGDPHGSAHVSFTNGPIRSIGQATQDPLFFMLHCNIDRLWAKWQLANNLFDLANANTYMTGGSVQPGDAPADTMWPWNGVTGPPRPPTAPGGPFPQLGFPSRPAAQITVGETIDYIGRTEGNELHFDYDDVPFI